MDEEKVYKSAKTYWEAVPATVSGMLDGFTQINSIDLSASNKFIRQFFEVSTIVLVEKLLLICNIGLICNSQFTDSHPEMLTF